jgi:hypothetical protein
MIPTIQKMWCAGYIMNGGCSDDGFEYFQKLDNFEGKDTYYKANKIQTV